MLRMKSVLAAMLMLSQAFGCLGASTDREKVMEELVDDKAQTRLDALETIRKTRDQEILNLVNEAKRLMRSQKDRQAPKDAKIVVVMEALGVMRAVDAISFLVDNIDFKIAGFEPGRGETVPLYAGYPALHALVKIGSPSSRRLLDMVQADTKNLHRHLAVVGLVGIFGNGADYLAAILRVRKDRADNKGKENLEKALTLLKTPGFFEGLPDF